MKIGLKFAAMAALLVVSIAVQADKVHDHRKSKGLASGNSVSETPQDPSAAQEGKIHDHRKSKGLASGSNKTERADQKTDCVRIESEQDGSSSDDKCGGEDAKEKRVHDHRKMKNLP